MAKAVKEKDVSTENADELNEVDSIEGKKKTKKVKKDKKGKKGGKKFLVILILLLIAGFIVAVAFNLFNLRDEHLRGPLEKIPVVKNMLPEIDDESEDNNEISIETESKTQEKRLKEENEQLWEEIDELNKQIETLKEVEEAQLKFKEDKELFDLMIAEGDPEAYATFYEEVYPENAEKIYAEVIQQRQAEKDLKLLVKDFENMKKDSAAAVLETMMISDMDLVVQILYYMDSEKVGDIFTAMDPKNAAACARRLVP